MRKVSEILGAWRLQQEHGASTAQATDLIGSLLEDADWLCDLAHRLLALGQSDHDLRRKANAVGRPADIAFSSCWHPKGSLGACMVSIALSSIPACH